VFLTIYICTINLLLLFDNTTGLTHLKILSFQFTINCNVILSKDVQILQHLMDVTECTTKSEHKASKQNLWRSGKVRNGTDRAELRA